MKTVSLVVSRPIAAPDSRPNRTVCTGMTDTL